MVGVVVALGIEVVVIGAGLSGISCARELAMNGKRVVLLEARELCIGWYCMC